MEPAGDVKTDQAVGKRTECLIGVDPGLNITGYGILDVSGPQPVIREAGVVRSRARGSLETRLAEIHDGLREVLLAFQPDSMAVEQLYSHYKRPRTAILMGHARGVICLSAAHRNIRVYHYAATQVKKMLTGNGRAPKSQIQFAICREFGLTEVPEPADVADALAIALCHFHFQHNPLELS